MYLNPNTNEKYSINKKKTDLKYIFKIASMLLTYSS